MKQAEQSIQERAFLGIQWLSTYLGIRPKSVYAMVEENKIPHYRIGRLIRFKRSEIDEWMKGNRKECAAPEQVAMKVLALGPMRKPKIDIGQVVRKSIDGAKREGYTKSHGKPDQVKGLGKEVPDGTV